MIWCIPTLKAERTHLRPFTPADAPEVELLAGAPEVSDTMLGMPHPYPPGAAAPWIANHAERAADGGEFHWAIVRKADGRLLGAIRLTITTRHARDDLGYWLGISYWNQGYTSEAARCVIAFGFDELRLHRVQAGCMTRNPASARVMEKAGMRFEGIARGYLKKHDHFEDIATYARLRTDPSLLRKDEARELMRGVTE